ncbi:MAG: Sapep family Mn(2+)-dependent dipeptidase [Armatimonadetes bacterium]|nr:Sapep family Mn(2+)-dependent dipeptidase [Armatimonadota bacterium]
MSDPVVSALYAWLKEHQADLLQDYQALLRIPSIEDDAEQNAPFGKANRAALDLMLRLSQESGMTTKDLEGYAGWAEFGKGDKMVMTLGHVDVVPVGPGWKHEPFGAEVDEGYVYARGAVDDKGPTMASFYAMKAIQAVVPEIGARMRSVFGCNEESGFKCVERYMETEEAPTYGVAPDSGWPCIHGEKGIANFVIDRELIQGDLELLEVDGGQRPNIVIDSCRARARVSAAARAEVEEKVAAAWDRNLTAEWQGDVLNIQAIGKAAHGAFPMGGDNAATRALRFLKEIAPVSVQEQYVELMEVGHIGGDGLGIAGSDKESGSLTANLGIVRTVEGRLRMTVNVRYPVTWKGDDLRATCKAHLEKLAPGFSIFSFSDSKPLYFPLEHPLVKTICDVYRQETGDTKEPGTMGGGTYARAVPNTVSIGTGWAGDGEAHETDERCAVESLYKMSRIYAHLFYRLAQL